MKKKQLLTLGVVGAVGWFLYHQQQAKAAAQAAIAAAAAAKPSALQGFGLYR